MFNFFEKKISYSNYNIATYYYVVYDVTLIIKKIEKKKNLKNTINTPQYYDE